MKRAFTLSRGIKSDQMIAVGLGRTVIKGLDKAGRQPDDLIVGWGQKDNTLAAKAHAEKHQITYAHLEDGFIGYLSHPELDKRRLSLIVDYSGIYYDARQPSDLEKLIVDDSWFTDDIKKQAISLMGQIVDYKITKYNHATEGLSPNVITQMTAARKAGKTIRLLVDQVKGDKGISLGLADQTSFDQMLSDALACDNSLTVVKTHPDVLLGKKKGCLSAAFDQEKLLVVSDNCAPMDLLPYVDHVCTVTSQMGFDALMVGKAVSCYGMPFYAGWGLTDDKIQIERRGKTRCLEHIFAAAFMRYTRYICPYQKRSSDLGYILQLLISRRQMPRITAPRLHAYGFSLWKRGFLGNFIENPQTEIHWHKIPDFARTEFHPGDAILYWGRRFDQYLEAVPDFVDVWRVEDGFIRSVGLGVDLKRPASLAFEKVGIYYDCRSPSALESFLNSHPFSDADQARGAVFLKRLKKSKVSKYNVGKKIAADLNLPLAYQSQHVALVTGQVEEDKSLAFGSPIITTNQALIEAVRQKMPDAFLIYKPHPDVLSGNRMGVVPKDTLDSCVNMVMGDVDIQDCMTVANSVHVMTSGAGFEALVQGKDVYCYGLPFYAGWGLTKDEMTCERRQRSLSLSELVYAAYIVYPTYVSWPSGTITSPERILDELAMQKKRQKSVAAAGLFGKLRGIWRKSIYLLEALLR